LFFVINGYRLVASNADLEKFTIEVARSQHTLDEISTWLEAYARSMDGS